MVLVQVWRIRASFVRETAGWSPQKILVATHDDFSARLCAKHQPQRVGSASGSGLIPALVCRSFPLRLVLRTQPRSFGGGPTPSASLRIVARRRSTCRALAPGAVRGCAPATLPPDNALDGPARLS